MSSKILVTLILISVLLTTVCSACAVESSKYDAKKLSKYCANSDWSMAISELNKLLAVRPSDLSALRMRCYCNVKSKKFDHAFADVNRAIKINSNDSSLFVLRASIARKLGKEALALADYQKAQTLKQVGGESASSAKNNLSKVSGKTIATNVIEKNHTFATKYETGHLLVFCDCDSAATQSLVEPLEGFISYVDKYVCPLKGKYPLLMYIFKDENAMNEFFKVSLGETSSGKVFGRYISPMNAVVTYNGSGLGTMTHEIMHKVLDGGVAELDPWAKEGIPTIFEKTYGYPTASGWKFSYGYQNPWRLAETENRWNELRLSRIVQHASFTSSDNESEERLVATFLNDNGKLQRYLELARIKDKRGFNTYLEAAFGCSMEQIEPRFQNYLGVIRSRWKELIKIPSSRVFSTEEEFLSFLSGNAQKFKPLISRM